MSLRSNSAGSSGGGDGSCLTLFGSIPYFVNSLSVDNSLAEPGIKPMVLISVGLSIPLSAVSLI